MENLKERVSVSSFYDQATGQNGPREVVWRGRSYLVDKVGLHHRFWQGRTLVHLFSVLCGSCYLRLRLETDSLVWFIESFVDQEDDGV